MVNPLKMSPNNGEPQTTESGNPQGSKPGSPINIQFVPQSSGSYISSNGSDESSSPVFKPPGSYTSSNRAGSPVYTNTITPTTTTVSCKFNTAVNPDITSLHKSSGSCSRNISTNTNSNSTEETCVPTLPHSSGSCTKSNTSTLGGIICRICHDGESDEKLVSPCLCTGTQGLIHKTCLERWLSTASYDKCELCHFPFHLRKKPKSFFDFLCHKWEPDMRRAVAGDLLCFLVLTPLTLISSYLCGRGAIQYFTDQDYYDNRNIGSDREDLSIFSSPFGNRYQERQQISTEHGVLKTTSFGASYIEEEGNLNENQNPYNAAEVEAQPLYMEASGLLVLALMLLVIYSCWLAIAVRYHVKTFRRWQRVHQDLVLVDVSNPGPICRLNLSFISSNSPPQIYTLPQSSYVDLDENREQQMFLVPEVHNEGHRSSIFSRSNSSSAGDTGRKTSIFRSRTASECVRRLSEVGRRSSLLVGRRASEGGRRASIFSSCLSPAKAGYEELSGEKLLDTSKKISIKKYAGVNSLNIISPKKNLNVNKLLSNEKKGHKFYGATLSASEETKSCKAIINTPPAAKETRVCISPVAPDVSIPICLDDYESPESYRIACEMYAEALYNRETAQTNTNPEHFIGIDQFPFSPSRFQQHRRDSSKSTHF